MDIDGLTIGQVKEISKMVGCNESGKSHSFHIGHIYFIQTVTHYFSGRLIGITGSDIALEDAAWIADTGRFSNAMEAVDKLAEVEPIPGIQWISRGAIVGFTMPAWSELPTVQK
jgi:hypothetical protein